ncbi:hypothetical protein [Polynucleobacter sp.]|uniref:hypothetical protein n=1 Tax=Polynucleobacter sp. TaxID=2029855 RepID=UPI0033409E92
MMSKAKTPEMSKPTLLIIKHFYNLKAAEHEVVQRLVASSKELGWVPKVVEVNASFDFKDIKSIEKNVDAVLDIHYEYPKFFSAKSIGAFWTPTSFMKDWDLAYVWENQLSHDNLVHTDSQKILELLKGFRPKEEFGVLNHSLPGSWVEWINEAQRDSIPHAFYAGINWSKLSGRKGRHHEMFKLLDDKDVLNIYGPRKISHVVPWKGFESYRGEIPFDGKSILRKARESGVSLVLSSEQHLSEGIISSRFFEGLAAGNSIISDGHPFIRKHLGKDGFYLDLERGDRFAADQLFEFMQELRQNPKLLAKQQEFSQHLFMEKFDLTVQLKKILVKKKDKPLPRGVDALILGNSENDLRGRLTQIGFARIEQTNALLLDIQDLVSLARSLELSEFCVFYSNTEVLEGFEAQLKDLLDEMKKEGTQFGALPTVALSQGGRQFAPVIMGNTGTVPLNGLVINLKLSKASFTEVAIKVPCLRVQNSSELPQVSTFHDSYSFLLSIGQDPKRDRVLSLRKSVKSEFDNQYSPNQRDLIEEIRLMPRARRRVLGFSLLAALPFMRPVVGIAKWMIRKKS